MPGGEKPQNCPANYGGRAGPLQTKVMVEDIINHLHTFPNLRSQAESPL
jgi:hypothetical protein